MTNFCQHKLAAAVVTQLTPQLSALQSAAFSSGTYATKVASVLVPALSASSITATNSGSIITIKTPISMGVDASSIPASAIDLASSAFISSITNQVSSISNINSIVATNSGISSIATILSNTLGNSPSSVASTIVATSNLLQTGVSASLDATSTIVTFSNAAATAYIAPNSITANALASATATKYNSEVNQLKVADPYGIAINAAEFASLMVPAIGSSTIGVASSLSTAVSNLVTRLNTASTSSLTPDVTATASASYKIALTGTGSKAIDIAPLINAENISGAIAANAIAAVVNTDTLGTLLESVLSSNQPFVMNDGMNGVFSSLNKLGTPTNAIITDLAEMIDACCPTKGDAIYNATTCNAELSTLGENSFSSIVGAISELTASLTVAS